MIGGSYLDDLVHDVTRLLKQSVGEVGALGGRGLGRAGEAEAGGHVEEVGGRQLELQRLAVDVQHARRQERVLGCCQQHKHNHRDVIQGVMYMYMYVLDTD